MDVSRYEQLVRRRFADAFTLDCQRVRDLVLNTAAWLFLAGESDTELAAETRRQMRRIADGQTVEFTAEALLQEPPPELVPVALDSLEKDHGMLVDLAEPERVPGNDPKVRLRGTVDRIVGRPRPAGVLQVVLLDYEGDTISAGRCDVPEAEGQVLFDFELDCFDMVPVHVMVCFDPGASTSAG